MDFKTNFKRLTINRLDRDSVHVQDGTLHIMSSFVRVILCEGKRQLLYNPSTIIGLEVDDLECGTVDIRVEE